MTNVGRHLTTVMSELASQAGSVTWLGLPPCPRYTVESPVHAQIEALNMEAAKLAKGT